MKLSVMHISDLHRDPDNPIRNDVLLDSLVNDHRHYTVEEQPALRSPDLVIVSGDIIHGIRADEPDPDRKLGLQYEEALDFLGQLASRFVGGDRQGAIDPACIAAAALRLRHPSFRGRLRAAVWHHNVEGTPLQSDYIDPDLVQNLIDREFSLGFHGHQHRPQFLDTRFRHGLERRITIISAGTLCGSAPFRHGRAYNIVELDRKQESDGCMSGRCATTTC